MTDKEVWDANLNIASWNEYEMREWIATARHMLEVGAQAVPRDDPWWRSRHDWCLAQALGFASK